jgi:hypothetical protein
MTRDALLTAVAIVAIAATAWLLNGGTGADAIAPIIALAGVALGRISGANTPTAPAAPETPDFDAFTGDH